MVEKCGATVEQCWWNSVTVLVEQCRWNSDSEIVRWNSKTVFVEQCGGTVEQWNSDGGTVLVD